MAKRMTPRHAVCLFYVLCDSPSCTAASPRCPPLIHNTLISFITLCPMPPSRRPESMHRGATPLYVSSRRSSFLGYETINLIVKIAEDHDQPPAFLSLQLEPFDP